MEWSVTRCWWSVYKLFQGSTREKTCTANGLIKTCSLLVQLAARNGNKEVVHQEETFMPSTYFASCPFLRAPRSIEDKCHYAILVADRSVVCAADKRHMCVTRSLMVVTWQVSLSQAAPETLASQSDCHRRTLTTVIPRLHDTTGSTTGLTTGCIQDTAGCQCGCQTGLTTGWIFVCIHDTTGCQTGLTTGCIVYTNI